MAGLCEQCRACRRVANRRGSVFLRCTLAERDARFQKYPRQPVLACPGFRRVGLLGAGADDPIPDFDPIDDIEP